MRLSTRRGVRTTCVVDCVSVRPCHARLTRRRGSLKGREGRLGLIAHLLLPRFSTESPEVPNLGNGDEAPGGEAARPLLISDASTMGIGSCVAEFPTVYPR